MKVLVTVKEVAEVEDEFELAANEIDDRYLKFDLNEWDDYAVEEAVQLSEESEEDVEVVAVTIGPERSEETIRMALAKGVDRAVRVWDDALAEAAYLDVATKTDLLKAVVTEEDPDLILTGVQAGDDAFSATGVSLADAIGFEWTAVVNALDLEVGDDVASVHRELEGGVEELTDVELPAVLTIQTGINDPRYASLRGIRQAQSKEIVPEDLESLGLGESVVEIGFDMTDMYEPESESDATIWDGSAEEGAQQLADFLQDKGVVEG